MNQAISIILLIVGGCLLFGLMAYSFFLVLTSKSDEQPRFEKPEEKQVIPDLIKKSGGEMQAKNYSVFPKVGYSCKKISLKGKLMVWQKVSSSDPHKASAI